MAAQNALWLVAQALLALGAACGGDAPYPGQGETLLANGTCILPVPVEALGRAMPSRPAWPRP